MLGDITGDEIETVNTKIIHVVSAVSLLSVFYLDLAVAVAVQEQLGR